MTLVPARATSSLALIQAASRLLAEERPLAARVHTLCSLLREIVPHRDARLTIWLNAARPGSVRQQFHAPYSSTLPWDDSLTRAAALNGDLLQKVISSTITTDTSRTSIVSLNYLGAPMIFDGRLWGVLELRVAGPAAFTPGDCEAIRAVLPLIAAAVAAESSNHTALTVRDPASQNGLMTPRQRSLLESISRELEAPLSLHSMLALLLRWALDSTGAEAGSISLVDRERGEIELQLYEGYAPDTLTMLQGKQPRRWSWSVGIAGRVARTGRAVLLRDVVQDPDYTGARDSVRAELVVPVCIDGVAVAVLVFDSPRAAAFGDAELAFATALAERAAQPLRRAMRYQEAIETSTQLRQVFNSLPTAIALLDTAGNVMRHNPAWLTLWGITMPAGTANATFNIPWDLVPQLLRRLSDPERFTEFCASSLRNDSEVLMTTVLLQHPTQELHILTAPTRDSLGQVTGRLWAVSDVTREREVDRLKSEFVSIVSHELRTPLTSILGYTELLLNREFAPDEQHEFFQTVYEQATHLSQLVEDLLGVSRLDAGKVKLNCWMVSPNQLVRDLTSHLNKQIGEQHRLLIRIAPDLPPIFVDKDKIRQVLLNLLNNAVKYSPSGGEIELTIADARDLPADHPPGTWLLIRVRDQGVGISPQDLPRIWERFYRVDNSNTRRIGGTGLGLSITRSLVELHGGRIWAESQVDVGSTFSFTVPVATDLIRRGA